MTAYLHEKPVLSEALADLDQIPVFNLSVGEWEHMTAAQLMALGVRDTDGDTKFEVERGADDDTLRGVADGFDALTITKEAITLASSTASGSAQITTSIDEGGGTASGVHSIAFGVESATRQMLLNDGSLGDMIADIWADGVDTILSGLRVHAASNIKGWRAELVIGGVSEGLIGLNYDAGASAVDINADAVSINGAVEVNGLDIDTIVQGAWAPTYSAHSGIKSSPDASTEVGRYHRQDEYIGLDLRFSCTYDGAGPTRTVRVTSPVNPGANYGSAHRAGGPVGPYDGIPGNAESVSGATTIELSWEDGSPDSTVATITFRGFCLMDGA
jgi:hypothetical protein